MSFALLSASTVGTLRYPTSLLAVLAVLGGMTQSTPATAATSTKTTWAATLPSLPSGGNWTVSVSVFDAQGTQVRRLTTGVSLAPGSYTGSWDGRNDAGLVVASGPTVQYQFRLVRSATSYVWEGVIGNTSSSFNGTQVHMAFQPVNSLVIAGNQAHYAVGYNEQQPGLSGFALSAPQQALRNFASSDPFASYSMVAADGERLYWANTGGVSRTSFVGAFDAASYAPYAFSQGQAACLNTTTGGQCVAAQSYAGVIDLQAAQTAAEQDAKVPTGLAVQRGGNLLAVAHGGQNVVRLYNKYTGAYVNQISVTQTGRTLNQIAFTAAGDLWVVSGTSVLRYANLTTTPTLAATVSGFVRPLALSSEGASVDQGGVWVADGGSSQQLKHFTISGSVGTAAGDVIGSVGGYASQPAVTAGKLCFKGAAGQERTALATEAGGAVWVVDTCNNRLLHFAANTTTADNQIAYLPAFYTSAVDHNNPERVFANFLEFRNTVNHAAPLQAGGGAWPLVRNWLAGLPTELVDSRTANSGFGGLSAVETLSNGRTYGLVKANGRQAIVELPSSGPLRLVQLLDLPGAGQSEPVMYENGDLGFSVTNTPAQTQTVYRRQLTGFDGSGNPLWAAAVSQATVPMAVGSPYYRMGVYAGDIGPRFPVTSSGRVVFMDQSVQGNEGSHLGAANLSGSGWLWQNSATGALNGKGAFQTKRIDNTVNYGGMSVWASGGHILYGYSGAAFTDLSNGRVGYANQFMHYNENGAFLGQFGESSTSTTRPVGARLPNNPLSPTLVQESGGGPLFVYSSDESGHGGIHRWRIDGASAVNVMNGTAAVGATVTLN